MHLYLIRHGESHVNLSDWQGGHVDSGLTDLGKAQAEALAAWLPQYLPQIDALYTSSMHRATETAAYLAQAYGMEARIDNRVREYGNNKLDHRPWPSDGLPDTFAKYHATERPFSPITLMNDQDESWMHFRTRVGQFIESMVETHLTHTVVVVCHGGVIQGSCDHVFGVGPWRRCEVWNANTSITYLEYVNHPRRELWRLHCQNRIEHLGPDLR